MKKSNLLLILIAFAVSSVSGFSERPFTPGEPMNLTEYEVQKFESHVQSRLPLYIDEFRKYANMYQIPWPLLAAVAYQESKWDHAAVSYTGVRGLMQITEQTAEHIGIEDRRDPIENIRGGAYYLKYLFNKTSPALSTMQRWSHALIAYNLGWGHFRDACRLAHRLSMNPLKWDELKQVLPKLENEEFYSGLNHGFARGTETVEFVDNVFSYYNLLANPLSFNSNIASL